MAGKNRARLTDASIARLRPREREYTVWDLRLPGFGVRVRTTGARTFVLLLDAGGRSRRVSLGPVEARTVEEIRREAHALAAASPPNGPHGRDGTRRTAPLFRDFVEGPWKEAHFDRYKPSTKEGARYTLRNRLLPTFGPKPLDRISLVDVRRWFDTYSRTSPGGANRGLDLFRQIMNFAVSRGLLDTNPARNIKHNPRPRCQRRLKIRPKGGAKDCHLGWWSDLGVRLGVGDAVRGFFGGSGQRSHAELKRSAPAGRPQGGMVYRIGVSLATRALGARCRPGPGDGVPQFSYRHCFCGRGFG